MGFWWDARHQGWAVALSPGALDVETGKAAILAELTARFAPEAAALLSSTLAVYPTLYSGAELMEARTPSPRSREPARRDHGSRHGLPRHGRLSRHGLLAAPGDPENVARVQALIGQYGDKVRVTYGVRIVPVAGVVPAPAAVNAGQYATVPKAARCVRGKAIGVRAADDAAVRSVTLQAGKRSVTAKRGKRAQLALKSRSTRVTLTVSLRDGRTATQTFTYRRCG